MLIGLGAGTLAIRLKNGPNGAVHSSKVILEQTYTLSYAYSFILDILK